MNAWERVWDILTTLHMYACELPISHPHIRQDQNFVNYRIPHPHPHLVFLIPAMSHGLINQNSAMYIFILFLAKGKNILIIIS